jgi:manganese oxidase
MFSVVKVREGLGADDYRDPGWYQHPAGTVAYEVEGPADPPAHAAGARTKAPATAPKVVKPRNGGHDQH